MHSHTIRTAVFDIDGTLAMMDKKSGLYTALPGAVEAVAACRNAGIDVVAYTNGTFYPPAHYYPRLADAGFSFEPGRILTPAVVAAHHLKETGHRRIMALGVDGTTVPLLEAGLDVLPPAATDEPVDAVLIGWTRNFGLQELEALVEAVWNGALPYTVSDAPYFAGAKGRILGVSGAVSAMITQTTDVVPVVLGKPSTLGMDMISRLTGRLSAETVVIGDDPSLEIRMARKAGAYAIGVTTGLYDKHAFMRVTSEERAHLVLDTMEALNSQPWLSAPKGVER
jgi:HAD superfamily hydrolase (TIGR01450 family)